MKKLEAESAQLQVVLKQCQEKDLIIKDLVLVSCCSRSERMRRLTASMHRASKLIRSELLLSNPSSSILHLMLTSPFLPPRASLTFPKTLLLLLVPLETILWLTLAREGVTLILRGPLMFLKGRVGRLQR